MSGAEFFDPAWEFDCPKFRDFRVCSEGEEEADENEGREKGEGEDAEVGLAPVDWFDHVRAAAAAHQQRREEGGEASEKRRGKEGGIAAAEAKRRPTPSSGLAAQAPALGRGRGSRGGARGEQRAKAAVGASDDSEKENRHSAQRPSQSSKAKATAASHPPPPSKPSAPAPSTAAERARETVVAPAPSAVSSAFPAPAQVESRPPPSVGSRPSHPSKWPVGSAAVGSSGRLSAAAPLAASGSLSQVDVRVDAHLAAVASEAARHFPSFAPPPAALPPTSSSHRRAASHGRLSVSAKGPQRRSSTSASPAPPAAARRRSSSVPGRRASSASTAAAAESSLRPARRPSSSLTVPVSPPLLTAARRRPSHPSSLLSRESLELAEAEAERERQRLRAQSNERRAELLFALQPSAAAAASGPPLAVRSSTPLTRPAEFRLSTALRAAKASAAPPQPSAAASPAPASHRRFHQSGEYGVPRVHKRPVTAPQPFTFHTDQAAARRGQRASAPSSVRSSLSAPALPSPPVAPSTAAGPAVGGLTPAPFQLRTEERGVRKVGAIHHRTRRSDIDRRGTPLDGALTPLCSALLCCAVLPCPMQRSLLEARVALQKAADERLCSSFQARPLLLSSPAPRQQRPTEPRSAKRATTAPAPFALLSCELSQRAQLRLKAQVDAEREAEEQRRRFHARKVPHLLYAPPALPEPTERRPPTEAVDVRLQSEARATQRQRWEEWRRAEREAEEERRRAAREAEAGVQRRELQRLRDSLIHQPTPLPTFAAPQPPAKSSRPLTSPLSPDLQTRHRAEQATASTGEAAALR